MALIAAAVVIRLVERGVQRRTLLGKMISNLGMTSRTVVRGVPVALMLGQNNKLREQNLTLDEIFLIQ
jgi:hypothetical protein